MINNEKELYNALETLITDKKVRDKYSNEIVKTIRTGFLWESTAKKIIKDIEGEKHEN